MRNVLAKPVLETRETAPAPADLETRTAIAALQTAWNQFKDAHAAEMAEVKKRGTADAVTTEKVDRINTAVGDLAKRLEDFELRAKRAGAPGANDNEEPEAREYRADWQRYMRRGDISERLEKRAMSEGNNVEGGYLTAPEVDRDIAKLLRDSSPVRQVATVRQVGGALYKRPVSKSNNSSGWVGETDARPQTNPSDLAEVSIPTHEVYANVAATQTILDDAYINLEQFIAEETYAEFEKQEGDAFINGNGTNKPRGLLALSTTIETGSTEAAQGKLGIVKSGYAGKLGGSGEASPVYNDGDVFIECVARLRTAYRGNARWMMNRFTEARIRKIKDANGQYIWQPGMQAGTPSTLLGFPTTIADHMPDVADTKIPVLFGDFRRAYTIIDRIGVRILRDPFTLKPYVLFYVTKRVGGGVVISQAYKGIQTAA
jgi:HK97 family phage major capsid protein